MWLAVSDEHCIHHILKVNPAIECHEACLQRNSSCECTSTSTRIQPTYLEREAAPRDGHLCRGHFGRGPHVNKAEVSKHVAGKPKDDLARVGAGAREDRARRDH